MIQPKIVPSLIFVFAASFAGLAPANAATLTLEGANIAGQPGETIGWNFTLFNDQGKYLVLSGVDFTPTNGVFVGFLPLDSLQIWPLQSFHVINPGGTWQESFDGALHTGIGPFDINSFQVIGDVSIGDLTFTYDAYTTDPNGPSFAPDDPGNLYGQSVFATASVSMAGGRNGATAQSPPQAWPHARSWHTQIE